MKTTATKTPFRTGTDRTSPLIVNFGGGVDSTAILIQFVELGIRPDLVIFADTGSEKPETIQHVADFSAWLEAHDFPAVTVVSRPEMFGCRDQSLEENLVHNFTLPSICYGMGGCAGKWKHEPMDRYLTGGGRQKIEGWAPAKAAWARGEKPVKVIGYDAGPKDARRGQGRGPVLKNTVAPGRDFSAWHPLRDWGWDREACEAVCQAGIGYVPMKSACWFCLASKESELRWLAENHPDLWARALALEARALPRVAELAQKKGITQSVFGLWRKPRKGDGRPADWNTWARNEGLHPEAFAV